MTNKSDWEIIAKKPQLERMTDGKLASIINKVVAKQQKLSRVVHLVTH